ncbi:hypothetical protein HPP92_026822 [Vanilla planifolia]|uniref:Uncharacterized protein n=1 Tax=Vanilla planifolia TaxID=51239 RepID=A0A835U8Q8_VANPL|nr:hypothetical protein HPP92_027010 [Vanilla planifolia]KAG0450296.1 hypothetical protein HPP92_026822 [Vanilla planifolia]
MAGSTRQSGLCPFHVLVCSCSPTGCQTNLWHTCYCNLLFSQSQSQAATARAG